MSDDLISRQAAIDALGEEPYVWTEDDEFTQGTRHQWKNDHDAIEALPSAQPERKKGKWIHYYDIEEGRALRCSECTMVFWVGDGREGNYCPNCGAKMDEDEE